MTASNTIGLAVIGAGARARVLVTHLLKIGDGNVRVRTVYDPDRSVADRARVQWHSPGAEICPDYASAIRATGVDWVLVFSPNAHHCEQVVAGFEAGKHVFAEKPLATTIDDCERIYRAHQASGLRFATGFVLRYSPICRKVKALLDTGRFGALVGIEANEYLKPVHGGYIMRNWRRLQSVSGSHILEKCCHDLDLANWFAGSLPRRAASFGGNNIFVPENQPLMEKYGRETFCAWDDPHAAESPFTSDKDVFDSQVGILEYRNGVRATFQTTLCNAIPERRILLSCIEGTIVAALSERRIRTRCIGEEATTEYTFPPAPHNGGDQIIMRELYDTMVQGTPPCCAGEEGLESSVTAIALDVAAREDRIVDLEPTWRKLGR